MAETHVVSALVKKRSELLGEINHYEKLLKDSRSNLSSIDKTIHLFDATYKLHTRRVSKERYFKAGEAKVLILDMLRTATKPMSTSDIGEKIAFDKEIDNEEDFDLERFQKTILASLVRCEKSSLVERAGKDGLSILWRIKNR